MPINASPSSLTGLPAVWASAADRKKLKQFYSIERTGYLTVTELIRDLINDARTESALTVANITIYETHLSNAMIKAAHPENFVQNDIPWPPVQRIRGIAAMGAGYSLGDELYHYVNGVKANLKVVVTGVDTAGFKGVTSFEVHHSGSYDTTLNPVSTSKRMTFRARRNEFLPYVRQLDVSYTHSGENHPTKRSGPLGNLLVFQGRHQGNGYVGGNPGPTPAPPYALYVQTIGPGGDPNPDWYEAFGQEGTGGGTVTNGRGGQGDPDSLSTYRPPSRFSGWNISANVSDMKSTRWPTDGLWTNVDVLLNTVVFPGQELILISGNVESEIPKGTTITTVSDIEVVTGIRSFVRPTSPVTSTTDYFEVSRRFIWFTTSGNVKVDKGDIFAVRGNGFNINDAITTQNTAEQFRIITEAQSRVDPYAADRVIVEANVTSVNGTSVYLTGVKHGWESSYRPTIYEGMAVDLATTYPGFTLNGAPVIASIANITPSLTDNLTTANVVLSVAQPGTFAGKAIQLSFDTTQSYRLAFEAKGSQTVSVYAATSVQLRSDGNIARVTDYTGAVTDHAGIIGDVPSVPILKTWDDNYMTGLGQIDGTTLSVFSLTTGKTLANNMILLSEGTLTNAVKIVSMFTSNTSGGAGQYLVDKVYTPKTAQFVFKAGYYTVIDANIGNGMPGGVGLNSSFGNILTVVNITPGHYLSVGQVLEGNNVIRNTSIVRQISVTTGSDPWTKGVYLVNKSQSKDFRNSAGATIGNIVVGKVIDREIDVTDITQGFISRSVRVAQHPQAYPLSYFASFTNRGIFIGAWEGSWSIMQKTRERQISEKDAWFSWMLIQRPVDRKTGFTRTVGQSPVFCINSVGYKYWKFIVRERDVVHPTQGDAASSAIYYNDLTGNIQTVSTPFRVPADAHTEDSHALLNTTHQIALTEDSKYLVSFLYNLTTPRFRYSDELDMIGQTAGDVSMASSDVKITAYSEATQRVYKSLSANLPYNAGLRICVIKDIFTA